MASNKNQLPEDVMRDPAQTIPPTPIILQQEKYADFGGDNAAPRFLKNIVYGQPLALAGLVEYAPGQVTSKTLAQNAHLGITLFAMSAGEGISAHKSGGDAFVTVLEGRARIDIDDKSFELEKGQCIVMPAGHPHAVSALDDFKMLLVVVFPA